MQQGSLIRSGRKRGPDVWQFRWADSGPHGKRIYRKRVIGTVCQYPDADSARTAVTGLLREIRSNPSSEILSRSRLPKYAITLFSANSVWTIRGAATPPRRLTRRT
jgi:hypothetical protein